MVQSLGYVPEMDPFSLNFQTAGFDTTLFMINSANWSIMITAFTLAHILGIIILSALSRKFTKTLDLRVKIRNNLLWSGSIRLFMEAYAELCLTAALHLNSEILDVSFGSVISS